MLKLLTSDACSQDPLDMGFHGVGRGGVPGEDAEDGANVGATPLYVKPGGGGANLGAVAR